MAVEGLSTALHRALKTTVALPPHGVKFPRHEPVLKPGDRLQRAECDGREFQTGTLPGVGQALPGIPPEGQAAPASVVISVYIPNGFSSRSASFLKRRPIWMRSSVGRIPCPFDPAEAPLRACFAGRRGRRRFRSSHILRTPGRLRTIGGRNQNPIKKRGITSSIPSL